MVEQMRSESVAQGVRRDSDLPSPPCLAWRLMRYQNICRVIALLRQQLDRLHGMYSNKLLARWHALCEAQAWDEFIAELLQLHYDPAYNKAIYSHYPNYGSAGHLTLKALHEDALHALAYEVLHNSDTR